MRRQIPGIKGGSTDDRAFEVVRSDALCRFAAGMERSANILRLGGIEFFASGGGGIDDLIEAFISNCE